MVHDAKASHVGSALSVVDILAVLYSGAARISPSSFKAVDRDVIILSKGHACSALYAVLSITGFIPGNWLREFCADGSRLSGHVTHTNIPGVELSTGSLGHGLPYGVGVQLSRKLNNVGGRTFVILSDGECNEGTTWESALIASHHRLNRLVVIVDRNRIQSLGLTEDTLALEPFSAKWESFGWSVHEVDGHDHEALNDALNLTDKRKPMCIIANTTKGKGVDFMENEVLWHYKSPNIDELRSALLQIEQG